DVGPPHSATMPGTPLRTAVSITESPAVASTTRWAPSWSVKVTVGMDSAFRWRRREPARWSDELPAAVDHEGLAGDVVAVLAREEQGRPDDVLRLAGPLEGAAVHAIRGGVGHQPVAGLGEGEAGGDGVDGDPAPAELLGHDPGQPDDPTLGGHVVQPVLGTAVDGGRGQVDHAGAL